MNSSNLNGLSFEINHNQLKSDSNMETKNIDYGAVGDSVMLVIFMMVAVLRCW